MKQRQAVKTNNINIFIVSRNNVSDDFGVKRSQFAFRRSDFLRRLAVGTFTEQQTQPFAQGIVVRDFKRRAKIIDVYAIG